MELKVIFIFFFIRLCISKFSTITLSLYFSKVHCHCKNVLSIFAALVQMLSPYPLPQLELSPFLDPHCLGATTNRLHSAWTSVTTCVVDSLSFWCPVVGLYNCSVFAKLNWGFVRLGGGGWGFVFLYSSRAAIYTAPTVKWGKLKQNPEQLPA